MRRHLLFFVAALRARLRAAAAAAPGPLLTSLVAAWDLSEASGQRNDSHTGALHLTDNNTVTSAAGVGASQTAAAYLAANSEYLSRASGWFNPAGSDMSMSIWVKMGVDTVDMGQVNFANCFIIDRENTNNFSVFWLPDVAWLFQGVGTATVASGWRHLVITVTASTKAVKLYENAVQVGSGTYTAAASSGALDFGRYLGGQYTTGNHQAAQFWSRVITAAEITWLYNTGTAARLYADVAAYTG